MAFDCDCIKIVIRNFAGVITTDEINSSGTFNGQPYWYYVYDGFDLYLFWSVDRWYIDNVLGNTINTIAELQVFGCPFGQFVFQRGLKIDFSIQPCGSCYFIEDRTEKQYKSVRLPEMFIEQNRGLTDCCCKFMVLAGNGNESWKNDITSAWLKLSDPLDSVSFSLTKNGQSTNYVPIVESFPNELNAFYTTIKWLDVIGLDGIGCYKLSVDFNIAGISGSFIWGIYDLQPYTIQNALKTARIRAIFNGVHEIDQIDFTGSNVESTHRFYGYIGNRQPNTEIDNIIYGNREMKRVIRENLNDYEIITDPSDECIIKPMIDLFLLSENQLFISDYNAHNHSYRYLDIPVIVSESPTVEYKDISRKAVLKCKVSDKFKNQRTFY